MLSSCSSPFLLRFFSRVARFSFQADSRGASASMLRTLPLLTAGALFATTVLAAPATCSGAKYLDAATGTCKPCGSRTAKTCSSAAVATSCVPRYYLTADGRCVANGQCPTSTFANQSNGKCDKCFLPTYKTCSNGKSYSATSCMNNTCLPATGGRCLPFANIKNTQYCTPAGKIEACPGEGAQTCTVTGTTLSCKAPYFFTTSSSAPASDDATATFTLSKRISITPNPVTTTGPCVLEANCPSGTFGNTATRTCSPCGEGASRCTADAATACYSGYFLSDKKCVKTCPTGKKASGSVCVDESYCSIGIWEPFTKQCVLACYSTATEDLGVSIPAEYRSADRKTCLVCKDDKALECDQASGLAVSCIDGYILSDGKCVEAPGSKCAEKPAGLTCTSNPNGSCPAGQFWDCWRQTCVSTCQIYATPVEGGIIPALWPDSTDMKCKTCAGGLNVYVCNGPGPALGRSQGCFNSYWAPDLFDAAVDECRDDCISYDKCIALGRRPHQSMLAAPLNFFGTCPRK